MIREEDRLIVKRCTKLDKYLYLKSSIATILVSFYLITMLSYYIWIFLFVENKQGVPLWDYYLHKTIAVTLVPLPFSFWMGWFAWIFFNHHTLIIDSSSLIYRLTVIFKISEKKLNRSDIQSICIRENETGFGILFKTLDTTLYTFHFPRYKRSGLMAKDKILYYEKEFSDIEYIIKSISDFIQLPCTKIVLIRN
ncbi:MAG: hypothetical protein LBC02_07655 [Planctomycetaceae bacterium]|jgi:hypothetical protein|nr:hypothetical protein [Planctomycetaceae bacterium]